MNRFCRCDPSGICQPVMISRPQAKFQETVHSNLTSCSLMKTLGPPQLGPICVHTCTKYYNHWPLANNVCFLSPQLFYDRRTRPRKLQASSSRQHHLQVIGWIFGPCDGQLQQRASMRPKCCKRREYCPASTQGLSHLFNFLSHSRCAPSGACCRAQVRGMVCAAPDSRPDLHVARSRTAMSAPCQSRRSLATT